TRRGVADRVLIEAVGGLADIRRGAAVQHADMRAVELAFEPLQPVAMHDAAADQRVGGRGVKLEVEEFRRRRAAAKIDPDHAAGFAHRIVAQRYALAELGAPLGGLGRRVRADAVDREFPAVEDTAQSVFLVAGEGERHAAMGAILLEEADAPVRRAECDEILAEQAHALRRAIRFERRRPRRRVPELAQHFAHRRTRPDLGQTLVIFLAQHDSSSKLCGPRISPSTGREITFSQCEYSAAVLPRRPVQSRWSCYFIASFNPSSSLARNGLVVSHGVSGPIRIARSLVMKPPCTASRHTFSSVAAKCSTSGVLSNLPRYCRPRVHAKIDAIGLVEVSLPC